MRVVALEEHFSFAFVAEAIGPERIAARGFPPANHEWNAHLTARLRDVGESRVSDMDRTGLTTQVLSSSGPGAELLEGSAALDLARRMNDQLAEQCARYPGRLAGFAHLPMSEPGDAAIEFERAVKELGFHGAMVNGLTDGEFLDNRRFEPVLAMAEQLDLPVYLHPNIPPASVRAAYYDGLPGRTGFMLSTGGWGWHSETAIHVLRMVVSGTFDRHRKLKLIVGHMGEGIPAMLARSENVLGPAAAHLSRSIAETILDQLWITTSGLLTLPPFIAALTTFGVDRIMLSVDYPYTPNDEAVPFLNLLPLPPVDVAKIAHGTADALLKLA